MAIAFHVLTIKPKTIKQRPKKTNDGYSDEKIFFSSSKIVSNFFSKQSSQMATFINWIPKSYMTGGGL